MNKSVFTDDYNIFLNILISSRKNNGITQSQLAIKLKKPQSFVSKYETGERRLDVIEFITISKAIGIDPNKIIKQLTNKTNESSTY